MVVTISNIHHTVVNESYNDDIFIEGRVGHVCHRQLAVITVLTESQGISMNMPMYPLPPLPETSLFMERWPNLADYSAAYLLITFVGRWLVQTSTRDCRWIHHLEWKHRKIDFFFEFHRNADII